MTEEMKALLRAKLATVQAKHRAWQVGDETEAERLGSEATKIQDQIVELEARLRAPDFEPTTKGD